MLSLKNSQPKVVAKQVFQGASFNVQILVAIQKCEPYEPPATQENY